MRGEHPQKQRNQEKQKMNNMRKIYISGEGKTSGMPKAPRKVKAEPAREYDRPSVYTGSGGVNIRLVLSSGGIVGGGIERARGETALKSLYMGGKTGAKGEMIGRGALKVVKPRFPIIPPKVEKPSETKVEVEAKEVSSPKERFEEGVGDCCPPMDEHGNGTNPREGLTEAEERMVDFLDAAQEVIPELKKADEVIPEPPPETEETIAERAEETRATLPELPLGDVNAGSGKKRHRRRGRKPRESTEVTEAERAAIQAEVEAASDAAANGQ